MLAAIAKLNCEAARSKASSAVSGGMARSGKSGMVEW